VRIFVAFSQDSEAGSQPQHHCSLNSRLKHWLSDEDDARRRAADRLAFSLERLASEGVDAQGWVGDPDPVQAIDDALHLFRAERIVVATHPESSSNWLAC
jgi:hypothetical protein